MRFALSGIFVSLLALAMPAVAQSTVRSSSADRQRFVLITTNLEKAPLDPRLRADRQWAMQWLTEAPDVSVNACLTPLAGMSQKTYSHGVEIIAQYVFSMATLIIQHPQTGNNPEAQQVAGVEGALNAYRSILKSDPADRSAALDKLLSLQSRGELRGFVRKALPSCSGDGGEVHLP